MSQLARNITGTTEFPDRPSFLGILPNNDFNVTGDGTNYTIGTNLAYTKVFDSLNNFTTGGVFTAPVTGKYAFWWGISFFGIQAGQTDGQIFVTTTSLNWRVWRLNPGAVKVLGDAAEASGALYVNMNATDTANLNITISNGTKSVDISGSPTTGVTYFGGRLMP